MILVCRYFFSKCCLLVLLFLGCFREVVFLFPGRYCSCFSNSPSVSFARVGSMVSLPVTISFLFGWVKRSARLRRGNYVPSLPVCSAKQLMLFSCAEYRRFQITAKIRSSVLCKLLCVGHRRQDWHVKKLLAPQRNRKCPMYGCSKHQLITHTRPKRSKSQWPTGADGYLCYLPSESANKLPFSFFGRVSPSLRDSPCTPQLGFNHFFYLPKR